MGWLRKEGLPPTPRRQFRGLVSFGLVGPPPLGSQSSLCLPEHGEREEGLLMKRFMDLEDMPTTSCLILLARNEIRILLHLTTEEAGKFDICDH